MKASKGKVDIRRLRKKRDALMKELAGSAPFVDGSVVKVRRRCGNKNCRCSKGEKHESLYLMYKVKGVTKAVYIPVDLEGEVKKWSGEYKKVKETISEICKAQKMIIRSYVEEKRQKKMEGK